MFVNEDGSFAENWRENLPEDIRGEKSLESIKDFGSLAKSFVNAQRMVGADKIAIPGKYATDEDWNGIYGKLGRPEKADGYTFKKPDSYPADVDYSDVLEKGYKDIAHKIGLSDKQAANLYNWYLETQLKDYQGVVNAQKESREKALLALGPDKDKIIEKANKLIDNVMVNEEANKGLKEFLQDNEAGAALYAVLAAAFDRTMEDKTRDVGGGGGFADPKTELNAIMAQAKDANSPLMDASHPQHKDIMAKVQKLNEQIYGKELAG